MSPSISFLLFLSSLTILSITRAQERAPHGLANENPMALSPSAYDFFHPNTQKSNTKDACSSTSCSPLPMAAQVAATQANDVQVSSSQKGGSRVGAGGVAGLVFGFAFVVLLAMGVYYVVITRRGNMNRANSVQPDAWCARSLWNFRPEPAPLLPLSSSCLFLYLFSFYSHIYFIWVMECNY